MKRTILFIACLSIISFYAHAQNSRQKSFFGLGTGLDYGGIGGRVEFQPVGAIGIFAGFGYNLATPAFNGGISIKAAPGKRFCPVFVGMYGYNAAIKLRSTYGSQGYTYYGFSVGAGFELYNKSLRNKLLVEILGPFKSSKFKSEYEAFKRQGYSFAKNPSDVYFSIGYNFGIGAKNKK
jgi:hypothetical protein